MKQAKAQAKNEQIQKTFDEIGEFRTADEVDNYIARCTMKKKKMEMMKAQMQYLKKKYVHQLENLSNAKKLMTISNKSPEDLK